MKKKKKKGRLQNAMLSRCSFKKKGGVYFSFFFFHQIRWVRAGRSWNPDLSVINVSAV